MGTKSAHGEKKHQLFEFHLFLSSKKYIFKLYLIHFLSFFYLVNDTVSLQSKADTEKGNDINTKPFGCLVATV